MVDDNSNVVSFDPRRRPLPRTFERFNKSTDASLYPLWLDANVKLGDIYWLLKDAGFSISMDGCGSNQYFVITKKEGANAVP